MNNKIALISIIIVAFVLRFFQLGSNPPALTWDEVAMGYNAYSLGIDGKDEHGNFLPFAYIESFGDFKPPVYTYLDIIPIKIFGLTPFAVRFPSAFLGVGTVFLTYFLTRRIFYNSNRKELYALSSALVLALSPWHVMLSRAAFEANAATFFLVVGIWAFIAAVSDRRWLLVLSAVSFAISLYTFNSSRIAAPLLAILLAVIFYRQLFAMKKQVIVALFVGIVLTAPLVPFLLSDKASIRFQEVNIFTDLIPLERSNQEIVNDENAIWSKILHNRRLVYGFFFIEHYFDHFNPRFLFISGDINPKFSIREVGQLYLWDLPFFLVGAFVLFRKREGKWYIVPLWLLIGIIPAAIARETPHALRIESALPTFQILVGYGLVTVVFFIRSAVTKKSFRRVLLAFIFFALLGNIFYFQYHYWKHYPRRYAQDWQYSYKESIEYVNQVKDQYETIYVSEVLERAYIYYLFYLQVPPQEFRETVKLRRDIFGLIDVEGFDKYVFSRSVESEPVKDDALYINRPDNVPKNVRILKTFYMPDGTIRLVAYVY